MNNRIPLVFVAARRLLEKSYEEGQLVLNRHQSLNASLALGLAGALAFSGVANADAVGGGLAPATMLNNICTFILGASGQTLAILGIIGIGLSWMFGRVSLGLIAGVIGGIVIMFGASFLGAQLTGGGGTGG